MPVKLQPGEELVVEATFDPAWKVYSLLQSMIALVVCLGFVAFIVFSISVAENGKVNGIVVAIVATVAIVWIGSAVWWVNAFFDTLECYLTSRSLVYRRGIFWKTEKTIPLTRIQDLGMMQGPLMRGFGIHRLKIETAGQSAPGGTGEAVLIGVVGAVEFRDRVLGLRDSLDVNTGGSRDGLGQARASSAPTGDLEEIHETLKRIEGHLARMADSSSDQ